MNSGGNNAGWQVIEDDSYLRAVALCGGYEYVDQIIAPLDYHLHRKPTEFEPIPGFPNYYMAKTKLRISGADVILSHRLWFRVDEAQRKVWKLWVEPAAPEDMAFSENPWGEDDEDSFW
jgi:hypothetical protein